MARINRYDQAQPAKDNYFNTFVPLPLDQLTALGMARKQDLEKNQALLEKAYDDALDINYIKESPFEEANYRNITKGVTDLALKYRNADLTNPIEMANMRRELRSVADPTLIKRMEQSAAAYEQARALKMDMMSKGTWNDLLNEDPASKHNSVTGTYNWLPEAYMGREKLLEPYVKDLKPSFKGIDPKTGMLIMSVDDNDIARVANPERAQELLSTPAGRQEVRLFKKQYPNSAEGMSDVQIMNRILSDYAEQKKQIIADPMPEYMAKAMGWGQDPNANRNKPFENLDNSSIENFSSLSQVKSKITSLNNEGSTEEAKDLQIALDAARKKYNISEEKFNSYLESEMASNPKALAKTASGHAAMSLGRLSAEDKANLDKALNEISSTTAKKYAFGFTSDQLSNAVDVNGKKIGLQDFEILSSNFLANPLKYEVIDVDGKGRKKDERLKEQTSLMNTKNLENVDIDILPNEKKEFKPVIKFGYASEKDGKTTHHTATIAVNDPTQLNVLYDNLMTRGNYEGAAAVLNPQVSHAVKYDNFDVPQTYKVITSDGSESSLKVKRQSPTENKFDITINAGQPEEQTITVNSRVELTSEIYNILGQNPYSRFAKTK